MAYQTHKSITSLIIQRHIEMWKDSFRTKYENTPLSPTPNADEVWMHLKVTFGKPNPGRHICVDGTRRVDRHTGFILLKVYSPLKKGLAIPLEFTSLIEKTFSSETWHVEHFHAYPTSLLKYGKEDSYYTAEYAVPFFFNKEAASGDNLSSFVLDKLTNANSPLV